ncbi:MAG: hypothetical protein KAR13_18965 [Desulfobulbaceae bacterium]|nr:hypothetical protein [Desulfobulbaceae bacterium]
MPSFSEAFPDSNYIVPIADITTGGIELGIGVAFGTAGVIGFVAGPEFWPMAAPALGTGIAVGWDGQGRIRTGVERIGDNSSSDPVSESSNRLKK